MTTSFIIDIAKENFEKTKKYLHKEFAQIQAGQANPVMIESLAIDAYGNVSPLKNHANISAPEPQQLVIDPYDKSLLSIIETTIRNSNMGFNPLNDGTGVIRINIPPLTEERRRDLVKIVHAKAEEARVSIRKARQDALNDIRKQKDISEDIIKEEEIALQNEVNAINTHIEKDMKQKESDVMKV